MSMNEYLAQMYGTNGAKAQEAESLQKVAQIELFAKLAAEEGIDLTTMSPENVAQLYSEVMGKTAEEGDKKDEDTKDSKIPPQFLAKKKDKDEGEEGKKDEEKEAQALLAKAASEFEEKRASQQKIADAELMGQVMAHAYVKELHEIEKAASAGNAGESKEASGKPAANTASSTKEPSALDKVAAQHALKLCEAGGYDTKEAEKRLNAVLVLGPKESEKVAHVSEPGDAFHVRALELLEQAQYPVDWEEVFGK